MAEEKDTDSAPDDGVTESDAVAPSPRHGIGPATHDSSDEPESTDLESTDESSSESEDDSARGDGELEVPEELRDDESDDAAEDTDAVDDADTDEESEGDRELVGVGATAKSGESGPRSGGQLAKSAGRDKKGRAKKDKPTPKQRTAADKPKRTTPLEFVRGAISELKKVVYPTGSQLANYFVVVLVFVMLVIAIVTALDYGFGWAMLKAFA